MVFKVDGTFTTAGLHGVYRRSFPIERDTSAQIIEQDFIVAYGSYAHQALNTPHATVTDAYLVREGSHQDLDGGLIKFTRVYATVPAARDDYETFTYKFPGLYSTGDGNPPYNQYWEAVTGEGRDPFPDTVTSRVRNEYFLCATGETYETPDEIPILKGQEFALDSNANARMYYLLPAGEFVGDSTPTREAWLTLVGGGTGLGTGANAGEFIPEDSKIEPYMGNIWVRKTRYIKAQ